MWIGLGWRLRGKGREGGRFGIIAGLLTVLLFEWIGWIERVGCCPSRGCLILVFLISFRWFGVCGLALCASWPCG